MSFIESCFQMRFYSNVYGVYLFLEIIKNKNTVYLTYANVIKFMKFTSNWHDAKSVERQKTSFPKELVENAGLCKPVLNKIMTIHTNNAGIKIS